MTTTTNTADATQNASEPKDTPEREWTNPLRDPRDLRLPRIAGPCSIVIFGVTGDLSRKKLLPAIYDLANRGLLPPSFGLTGFARRDWSEDEFREFVKKNVQEHCRTHFSEDTWTQLAEGIRFVRGTFEDADAFERLSDTVAELDRDRGTRGNHAFYMSVPPRDFPLVAKQLSNCGLAKSDSDAWRRVIIEKPFGHDLESAKRLDTVISEVFDEDSVFRIDHYLGKETVQNLLALRFANTMYEPIWNANYVDHVQITMAEDIGVAGRAGYYDGIGAARDVIQNHLLQLMALTAMEEPLSFKACDLTAEKTKVLSAVKLPKDLGAHTARGQYAAGWQGSHEVVGYLEEQGIDPDSTTETYAAIRLDVDTRRWAGVPFYLRTGKRLGRRVTEIAVVFKRAPHLPFDSTATQELGKNALVIRVQPYEGITLRFGSKVPGGTSMEVRDVSMDFNYGSSFTESSPEAYERLILDVLLGDPPLFPTTREVDLSWKILDPIEEFWSTLGQPEPYRAGTWGPAQAAEMLARDGHRWRKP
ncbi:glucose-6-phosphate dehydrogenase [Bifidobacterium gallicum]|nr:glucose-6-phosphate dehydrogenase [Bifidobacterium gallicum]